MNRRLIALFFLALLIIGSAWQSIGYSQTAASLQSLQSDADPSARTTDFDAVLNPQVDALVHATDRADWAKWRSLLVSQMTAGSATPGFKTAYCEALSAKLLAELAKAEAPARLNIAVVAAGMGEASKSYSKSLVMLVTALLKDSSEGVIYWGEQAADNISWLTYKTAPADPTTAAFSAAIVASVGVHVSPQLGAPIANLALKALNAPSNGSIKLLPQPAVIALVTSSLNLLQARLTLYQTGIPDSPYSDSYTSLLYFDPKVWQSLPNPLQVQAVQETSDLMNAIGKRYKAGSTEMQRALQNEASGLIALEKSKFPNPTLDTALLAVQNIGLSTPPATVAAYCKAVYTSLLTVTMFANLTP